MKQRIAMMFAMMCVLALALGTMTANAQETGAEKVKSQPAAWSFYKLDFNVREIDNGKTLNTRSYTMNARSGAGSWQQIRVGTRVPYTGEKGPSYMDIGFNVDCRIEDQPQGQALAITTDLSSLPSDQAQEKVGLPLIRSLRSSSVIPITLNKPILVASVDEVGSTHRMQVEVTITQLK